MKVGIGLPATIPNVKGNLILEWARLAEKESFSSLGIIDRLVYPNYEPLVTLAAVSAVTQHIRLMTTILISTVRNPGILAKQVSSLDALSNGRLTLGLSIGGREDDFRFTSSIFQNRGKRFEQELLFMKRIWALEPPLDDVDLVGPSPIQVGGPEILIGGYDERALRRVGRLGDGYITGGRSNPEQIRRSFEIVQKTWQEMGRKGYPRLVAGVYFALGPRAGERGGRYLMDYYSFSGERAQSMAMSLPSTNETVLEVIKACKTVGVNELVLWPTIPEIDQVKRLIDLIG